MSKREEKTLRAQAVAAMFPEMAALSPGEKTAFRKTCYYRQRMNPAPLTLEEINRIPPATIWELCRVNWSTVWRWRQGKAAMPWSAQQLCRFILDGVIPLGMGDWAGSKFGRDGLLYAFNSAHGYSAADLRCLELWRNEAGRVPGLLARIDKLEKELHFHRSQTKTDGQMGFMRGLADLLENDFSVTERD
jgi:hypothetical protein